MQKKYVATVQILVDAEDDSTACDGLSELLSHNKFVVDWSYLKLGGQYCLPTERYIEDDYEEGNFISR